jgi:hypothetical protein
MNANSVAKLYDRLAPEERFRLILGAGARGDNAEQTRLIEAGKRIHLSVQDHASYAEAFTNLAHILFMDLLEEAARFLDAFHRAGHAKFIGAAESEEEADEEGGEEANAPDGVTSKAEAAWLRCLDIALAAGYVLKAKADGWKLFCTRMTIPPFVLWEDLPSFERLQRALALAEGHDDLPGASFTAEGMVRWLNGIRPKGEPAMTEVGLTAEAIAREAEELYRLGVERHGG